jgi:hypothetical protein
VTEVANAFIFEENKGNPRLTSLLDLQILKQQSIVCTLQISPTTSSCLVFLIMMSSCPWLQLAFTQQRFGSEKCLTQPDRNFTHALEIRFRNPSSVLQPINLCSQRYPSTSTYTTIQDGTSLQTPMEGAHARAETRGRQDLRRQGREAAGVRSPRRAAHAALGVLPRRV